MFDAGSKLQEAPLAVMAWKREETTGKSPLRSRTIWSLIVTWLGLLLGKYFGVSLGAEEQTAIVVVTGILMRLVTKQPVGFWEDETGRDPTLEPGSK
jgi:hypothetical protein